MKAQFIDKQRQVPEAMDFKKLRQKGIDLLQKLSGDIWTDYNEHDPGVTILEQLCYALTELAYRASFEVKDLLTSPKGYIAQEEQALYSPEKIFPAHALTLADYRKLIFDTVDEVLNVWILPVESQNGTLLGLYQIFLYVRNPQPSPQEGKAIIEKVRRVFSQNRNLCEDIDSIVLLKSKQIVLGANIEISEGKDLESLVAQIQYHINQYLRPEMRFYSLAQCLAEGMPLDEIFEGPLLKNGFIRDEHLKEKLHTLHFTELMKLIMQIEGIMSVSELSFWIDGQQQTEYIIAKDELLYFSNFEISDKQKTSLNFFKLGVQFRFDAKIAETRFNQLNVSAYRANRLDEQNTQISEGKYYDFKDYYSIQYHFPNIYGINQYGLPANASPERQAQARQLKAYLLFFEQILADYFAQLAHIKDIYSVKNIDKSYFWQSLEHLPKAEELFKGDKKSYLQALEQIYKELDNFDERRYRVLDYLLAIYGESFAQYSISKFNYYFSEQEFSQFILKNKIVFIRLLPYISKNRSKATDYLNSTLFTDNISGLEIKLCILLGLQLNINLELLDKGIVFVEKSTLDALVKRDFQVIDRDKQMAIWAWLENFSLSEDIDVEQMKEVIVPYENKQAFSSVVGNKIFEQGTLPEDFIREGIQQQNYRISTGAAPITAVFQYEQRWWHLGDFDSEKAATQSIGELTNFLKYINLRSESLHILEHILLRPDTDEEKYSFFVQDHQGEVLLDFGQSFTYHVRSQVVEDILPYIAQEKYYEILRFGSRFKITLNLPVGSRSFVHQRSFDNSEAALLYQQTICEYLERQKSLLDNFYFFVRHKNSEVLIPDSFFNFRLSIIFPSWTARFADAEFRSLVEMTVALNLPAHLSHGKCIFWDLQTMAHFEHLYYAWKEEKASAKVNEESLDSLAQQLTQMLYAHHLQTGLA